MNIYVRFCRFKIIEISQPHIAYHFGVSGNKLSIFGIEGNGRRLCSVHERKFIQHVGYPLRFTSPGGVESPNRIFDGFTSGVHLFSQRHFGEVHQRTPEAEILAELILQVCSQQRFALHAEHRLIFQLHIYICIGFDDRLIEYGDSSHHVIHRVVHIFYKRFTSGSHHHRSSRYIHGIQADFRTGSRAFVPPYQREFVFFAEFLSHYQRGVVQLLIHVFISYGIVAYFGAQVAPERFEYRKNDSSGRRERRVSFHIIKEPVGVDGILHIQPVQVHHPQQKLAGNVSFGKIL